MSEFDPQQPQQQTQQTSPAQAPNMNSLADNWRSWLDNDKNRAALMQFGIAMLQPPQFGQTGLGQFGNAIAEGGIASENLDEQRRKEEESQSLQQYRKDVGSSRATTADAATVAANARALNADTRAMNPGGGLTANASLNAKLKAQTAFKQWALKPDDTTGLTTDPVLSALGVATKAEVLKDPALRKKAQDILFGLEPEDIAPGAPGQRPGAAATPGGIPNLSGSNVIAPPPTNLQDFRLWAQNAQNARLLGNLKAAVRTGNPKAIQDAKYFEQFLTPDSVPSFRAFVGIRE